MNVPNVQIEESQRAVCQKYGAAYLPANGNAKTAFALSTKGQLPINGLRHPTQSEMSGWFIWCGETFSEARDFFAPLHTFHIYEENPEIGHLLGLPPGYRFLLAGDYVDVWYDESLLNI